MTTSMGIIYTTAIDKALPPCYDNERTAAQFDEFLTYALVKIKMMIL